MLAAAATAEQEAPIAGLSSSSSSKYDAAAGAAAAEPTPGLSSSSSSNRYDAAAGAPLHTPAAAAAEATAADASVQERALNGYSSRVAAMPAQGSAGLTAGAAAVAAATAAAAVGAASAAAAARGGSVATPPADQTPASADGVSQVTSSSVEEQQQQPSEVLPQAEREQQRPEESAVAMHPAMEQESAVSVAPVMTATQASRNDILVESAAADGVGPPAVAAAAAAVAAAATGAGVLAVEAASCSKAAPAAAATGAAADVRESQDLARCSSPFAQEYDPGAEGDTPPEPQAAAAQYTAQHASTAEDSQGKAAVAPPAVAAAAGPAATLGGLRSPQVSTDAPPKLQPVVSLDAEAAPSPNRAATEPDRVSGSLSGMPSGPLVAAGSGRAMEPSVESKVSKEGQAQAVRPELVTVSSCNAEAASINYSPVTQPSVSSTGAEAGWVRGDAAADAESPAGLAAVGVRGAAMSSSSSQVSVRRAEAREGKPKQGKQGQQKSFWGKLFQCCAAPDVRE